MYYRISSSSFLRGKTIHFFLERVTPSIVAFDGVFIHSTYLISRIPVYPLVVVVELISWAYHVRDRMNLCKVRDERHPTRWMNCANCKGTNSPCVRLNAGTLPMRSRFLLTPELMAKDSSSSPPKQAWSLVDGVTESFWGHSQVLCHKWASRKVGPDKPSETFVGV